MLGLLIPEMDTGGRALNFGLNERSMFVCLRVSFRLFVQNEGIPVLLYPSCQHEEGSSMDQITCKRTISSMGWVQGTLCLCNGH